jgi:hypothetical protein
MDGQTIGVWLVAGGVVIALCARLLARSFGNKKR